MEDRNICKVILGWVILATRPLNLAELENALQSSVTGTIDDLANTIKKTCGGLLKLSDLDDTVRPSHPSVIKFFLAYKDPVDSAVLQLNLREMHKKIMHVCCETLIYSQTGHLANYAMWNITEHVGPTAAKLSFDPKFVSDARFFLRDMKEEDGRAILQSITEAANKELLHSQLAESEKLLALAQIFAEKKFGRSSMEFSSALEEVAKACIRQQRFDDAASLFQHRVDILRKLERQDDLTHALLDVAEAHQLIGERHHLAKAKGLRLEAIERNDPEKKPCVFTARQYKFLGLLCEDQKEFDEAQRYFEYCKDIIPKLAVYGDLDWGLDLDCELREDIVLFEERMAFQRAKQGDKDSLLVAKLSTLCAFEEMHERRFLEEGKESVKTMIRKWYLACFMMDHEDNWPKSDELWKTIINWKRCQDGGVNTSSMAALVKSWAWNCKKHERWARARELAEEAHEIAKETYPPDSFPMAGHLMILGDIAFAQGRRLNGSSYYEQGVEIHEKVLGGAHPWTLHVKKQLADQHRVESEHPEEIEVPLAQREGIHPYTLRAIRTRREWRSLKDSAHRELYSRV